MARHLLVFELDDDCEDIENESDLESFAWDVRQSVHQDLYLIRYEFNIGPSED